MITPNKVIPLDESALGHVSLILRQGPEAIDLITLFRAVADKFESIDQFLLTLDTAFVLGRIELDPATRTVTYAR